VAEARVELAMRLSSALTFSAGRSTYPHGLEDLHGMFNQLKYSK